MSFGKVQLKQASYKVIFQGLCTTNCISVYICYFVSSHYVHRLFARAVWDPPPSQLLHTTERVIPKSIHWNPQNTSSAHFESFHESSHFTRPVEAVLSPNMDAAATKALKASGAMVGSLEQTYTCQHTLNMSTVYLYTACSDNCQCDRFVHMTYAHRCTQMHTVHISNIYRYATMHSKFIQLKSTQ